MTSRPCSEDGRCRGRRTARKYAAKPLTYPHDGSRLDAEVEALQRHHVQLFAWWFPTTLNDEAKQILAVLERHHLRNIQLWVMGGGGPTTSRSGSDVAKVAVAHSP